MGRPVSETLSANLDPPHSKRVEFICLLVDSAAIMANLMSWYLFAAAIVLPILALTKFWRPAFFPSTPQSSYETLGLAAIMAALYLIVAFVFRVLSRRLGRNHPIALVIVSLLCLAAFGAELSQFSDKPVAEQIVSFIWLAIFSFFAVALAVGAVMHRKLRG